jgi:hypothetical protein
LENYEILQNHIKDFEDYKALKNDPRSTANKEQALELYRAPHVKKIIGKLTLSKNVLMILNNRSLKEQFKLKLLEKLNEEDIVAYAIKNDYLFKYKNEQNIFISKVKSSRNAYKILDNFIIYEKLTKDNKIKLIKKLDEKY